MATLITAATNGDSSGIQHKDRSRVVACPHCGEDVYVCVEIGVVSAGRPAVDLAATSWESGLRADEIAIVQDAKAKALFEAFEQTVLRGTMAAHPPRYMERFFLTFLKTMQPKMIPSFALNRFISLWPNTTIEVYAAQGVAAVIADKRLKMFFPIQLALGSAMSGLAGNRGNRLRTDADEQGLNDWLKTKYGYVPATAPLFLQELRKRTYGEFAQPLL